jgi:hypothetical protein
VCIDFKILKVKVPIIFSGTQVFPACRDEHYLIFFGQFSVNPLYPIEKPVVKYSVRNS